MAHEHNIYSLRQLVRLLRQCKQSMNSGTGGVRKEFLPPLVSLFILSIGILRVYTVRTAPKKL